jgi:hypothetical protein
MGVEIDYFLPKLAVESGHYRDHQDEHGNAEHYAQDRNQGDDGKERALRLQVTQCEKETEGQFQMR